MTVDLDFQLGHALSPLFVFPKRVKEEEEKDWESPGETFLMARVLGGQTSKQMPHLVHWD
jgi:hypothetical protein